MRTYRLLSRVPGVRSYAAKFLALGFIGIHLPLLSIVVLAAMRADVAALPYILTALGATLAGTGVVLALFFGLLAPVRETARSLERYRHDGTLPALPTHYSDDAGRLMATTAHTLARLDQMRRFRRRLIGVLSHDLRTPLTSILLASDVLTQEATEGPVAPVLVRDMASTLDTAVAQMETLLTTLVGASQDRDTLLPFVARPVDSRALLRTVVERLALIAEHKGVHLVVRDAPRVSVNTDPSQLEQVLVNLLTNAVKFTPAGRTVTLGADAAPHGVTFVVTDEGIGMDAAQVAAAFTLDGPEQRPGTAGEPGTGLGLWIVDTFVRHLGGTVAVASVPGVGTTFRVFVPSTPPERTSPLSGLLAAEAPVGHA